VAVRLRDKALNLAEPQAAAPAGRLGGEERIEGGALHLRRHAHPGIGHRDAHVAAGRQVDRQIVGGCVVHPRLPRLDPQHAAIGHRVARVDDQVQQRAFQLV